MSHFNSAIWMLSEKILRIFINFFSMAYIARNIGPEQFGQVNYLYGLGFIAFTLSSLGLDQFVINRVSKDSKDLGCVIFSVLCRLLSFSIISIILYFYLVDILELDLLYISLFLCFSYTVVMPIDNYFVAIGETKSISFVKTLAFLFSSILKVLSLENESFVLFLLSFLVESIVIILFYIYLFYRNGFKFFPLKFDVINLSQVFPVFITIVITTIYNRLDQVLVANLLGFKEMGIYSVAASIASALAVVPSTLTQAIYPKALKSDSLNLEFIYKTVTIICAVSFLSVIILGDSVINLFFGDNYNNVFSVLLIMLICNWVKSLGVAFNMHVITNGMQKYSVIYYFVGCVSLLPLIYIMTPRYGIYGAALSSLIAQILANFIVPTFIKESFFRVSMIKMLKASTFGALFIYRDIKAVIDER